MHRCSAGSPARLLALLALWALATGCEPTPRPPAATCTAAMPPELDDAIRSALARHPGTPGVVVGVHRPDIGFAVAAHGWERSCADVPCDGAPMTVQQVFEIGSLMKTFRWVAIHRLAERGQIDLDEPVNARVESPPLPGVSLRDLMHHSSGMIDVTEIPGIRDVVFADPAREFSYDDVVGLLVGTSGPMESGAHVTNGVIDGFAVGADHHYSSIGARIAGEIAARVTGKDPMQLVRDEILQPLALSRTSHVFYDLRPAGVAQGYESPGRPQAIFSSYEETAAPSSLFGGLMYSDACDLLHYGDGVFARPSFLGEDTRTAIVTDVLPADGGTFVGLGFLEYGSIPGFWGHAGASVHGHSSWLGHRVSDRMSIVVLANVDSGYDHWQTHVDIANALGAH